MTKRRWAVPVLVLAVACLAVGPPPKEPPEERALRAVRQAVLDAFEQGDIDGVLKHLHPNVVVTLPNSETVRGHEGVRRLYEKMMAGDNRVVVRLTTHLTVDGRSAFYADKQTAVSSGGMENHFELSDGKSYKLESRWTSTLLKEKEGWRVVAFQAGGNVFDNGVMTSVLRTTVLWTGLGAVTVGALLGAFGSSMFRRKPPT
jgi:ketosteroid isomerase-like protein